jgi:hypothetical protein
MTAASPGIEYRVYLTDDNPEIGLVSPLNGQQLDFTDTGVWVAHGNRRDFFPYGRIEVIRERAASEGQGN